MPAAKQKASTAPALPGLSHLVPEQKYRDKYISRTIDGFVDITILRYARKVQETTGDACNVLIFGPTGPGKTSMVMAYGAEDSVPVVTIQCNGAVDPETFWGGYQMDETTGRIRWEDSEITQVIRHGGVVYLDEVNFLHPKVAAVFHGLLDARRQITMLQRGNEVIKAHPDLQVICAYNPDYEGTRPLNPAFKNRFALKLKFDYDEDIERELLGLPVMVEAAHKLRASHRAGDIETPVSTNMLQDFESFAIDLSVEFAVTNFLNAFAEDERSSVQEVLTLLDKRIRSEVKQMTDD